MVDWWVAHYWAVSPVLLVSWVVWVILSITLHELGHGVAAIRCGDDTPVTLGRMTLNPIVHIPWPWAWILFALFGFTWGLMPVDSNKFRGRYDDAKVAFAGPLVNLLLAASLAVLDALWLTFMRSAGDSVHQVVHTVLWVGVVINVMGFMFNLIPMPPLDGSYILASFFPSLRRHLHFNPIVAIIGMVLIFKFSGHAWDAAFGVAAFLVQVLVALLGGEWRDPL
jgi:Zn-dependent protease